LTKSVLIGYTLEIADRDDIVMLVRNILQAILVSVFALSCAAVSGEVIHFRMTGHITVDFLVGNLSEGIYEGAPFEVQLSYDSSTPDIFADDPQRGAYLTDAGPDNFLMFRAGAAEVLANGLRLLTGNDIDGWPQLGDGRPPWDLPDDYFQSQSQIIANFPHPPHSYILFRWRDGTRTALHSDALPLEITPGTFQDMWFELTTRSLNPVDQFTIRGIVTSVSTIPEPTSGVLALTAGVTLVVTMLRNRRRRVPCCRAEI
jgi:hypothetical protein